MAQERRVEGDRVVVDQYARDGHAEAAAVARVIGAHRRDMGEEKLRWANGMAHLPPRW